MSNDDWIKHDGKGYPGFAFGTRIQIKYRDGFGVGTTIRNSNSCDEIIWKWNDRDADYDIIEYKVVS